MTVVRLIVSAVVVRLMGFATAAETEHTSMAPVMYRVVKSGRIVKRVLTLQAIVAHVIQDTGIRTVNKTVRIIVMSVTKIVGSV